MKRSYRVLSCFLTVCLSLMSFFAAGYAAVSYGSWLSGKDNPEAAETETSAAHTSYIKIDMEETGVEEGISDEALAEMNVYGFPVGESPYFIYVEKGGHTLSVFEKDDYGLYTRRLYTWSTATGKTSFLTPVGSFSVGEKEEWYRWPSGSYSPYATKYYEKANHYGGLFIHGPIYRWATFDSVFGNTVREIGTNCSSGCLRTETQAAYFVYEKCPEGTIVKIVEGSPLGFIPDRKVYVYNQSIEPSLDDFTPCYIAPESIAFSEEKHTLTVGQQFVPEVVVSPENAGSFALSWTTNNPSILRISGGSVWAVRPGYAIVTATANDGQLSTSMLINITVHDVDTSTAPPDVGEVRTEEKGGISDDYEPISEDLIYLRINGKDFAINQNVKTLLNMLGSKFYQKQPAQSCAYEGLDRFFRYDYIKDGYCSISTVPMLAGGEDAVCEIEFRNYTDVSLESSKGIRLGDSFESVISAYGRHYTEVSVTDQNDPSNSFVRITYWAGMPNDPGVPSLYFTLDPESRGVKGMGIYSAKNMG